MKTIKRIRHCVDLNQEHIDLIVLAQKGRDLANIYTKDGTNFVPRDVYDGFTRALRDAIVSLIFDGFESDVDGARDAHAWAAKELLSGETYRIPTDEDWENFSEQERRRLGYKNVLPLLRYSDKIRIATNDIINNLGQLDDADIVIKEIVHRLETHGVHVILPSSD